MFVPAAPSVPASLQGNMEVSLKEGPMLRTSFWRLDAQAA